jgi:hypothetical protein
MSSIEMRVALFGAERRSYVIWKGIQGYMGKLRNIDFGSQRLAKRSICICQQEPHAYCVHHGGVRA